METYLFVRPAKGATFEERRNQVAHLKTVALADYYESLDAQLNSLLSMTPEERLVELRYIKKQSRERHEEVREQVMSVTTFTGLKELLEADDDVDATAAFQRNRSIKRQRKLLLKAINKDVLDATPKSEDVDANPTNDHDELVSIGRLL